MSLGFGRAWTLGVEEERMPLAAAPRLASLQMALKTETVQVTGIRCERCVNRLAAALTGQEGLEGANANLLGQVSLAWDDEKTSRDALLAVMAAAGFRETPLP